MHEAQDEDSLRAAVHASHHSISTEVQQADPSEVQPLRNGLRQSFAMESPVDGNAVLWKVDRHLVPFYFSLSLLCSIDRGGDLSSIFRVSIMVASAFLFNPSPTLLCAS